MNENNNQLIEDLTLFLLYLTSWNEKEVPGLKRAWKGYLFETLDALADKGLIIQSRTAKSVSLTETGIRQAQILEDKLRSKR